MATSTLYLNTDNFMQQFCAVSLGVGIPVSILLSSIISSLLTLLITYLCLTRGKRHKSTPPVQEPVYDPVSSGTSVEMKSNVAYGQVTTGRHVTYETVPQWMRHYCTLVYIHTQCMYMYTNSFICKPQYPSFNPLWQVSKREISYQVCILISLYTVIAFVTPFHKHFIQQQNF